MTDPTTESLQSRIEHIYRMAAERDCDGVMDGLFAEFPYLRPPEIEKRVVARIARGRNRSAIDVQD